MQYTEEELKKIIENHQHWLNEDCKGWEEMNANLRRADLSGANLRRADLSDADLSGADLSGANLRRANLSGADLSGADLSDADLSGADLSDADLSDADLSDADLSGANLSGADLSDADLSDADLRRADLSGANLRRANLSGANLSGADLSDADLSGADLSGANLRRADLSGAEKLITVFYNEQTSFFALQCPESGQFEAWKKAIHDKENVIVHLLVPSTAKRSSATSRKCRVSEAQVLDIKSLDGNEEYNEAKSNRDNSFVYCVGETVKVENFDDCRWNECAPGIHCFITRQEAVNY